MSTRPSQRQNLMGDHEHRPHPSVAQAAALSSIGEVRRGGLSAGTILQFTIDGVAQQEDPICGGSTGVAIMDTFDHLLNWKLKVGSHPFPGPNGGTCINEAAVVAAGFEYQAIHSVEHMPECFSRPICRFAMRLNDEANDDDRQRLLPYVTRLACADSPEVEERRAAYINRHVAKCVVNLHLYGRTALDFDKALLVLKGALAIGRQAEPLEQDEVRTRMDKARAGKGKAANTAAPGTAGDQPFFSKAKSWLTTKVGEHTA